SSEFRLLAISCINRKDMIDYKKNSSKMHPTEIPNNGFTFVFVINNDYSINYIDNMGLPIKYGGIVKFFSKENYMTNRKTEKDKLRTDKSNQENADRHFLILLTFSGIYKYQMKNKSINNIQKLKYPQRIYNAIINNLDPLFEQSEQSETDSLIDTMREDFKYIELYDLKTNQLVNTFRRQIPHKSIVIDFPYRYAVSNNGKLLAYESVNKIIKLYFIECGLEIAELIIANPEFINVDFIAFFHNDEMLLIYSSGKKLSIWNIFGTLRDSVRLENPKFTIDLNVDFYNMVQSNSFMVVKKANNLVIYDDLIVDKYLKYLKKSDKHDWMKLSEDYFLRQGLNKNIRDLHDKESKLDEYYYIFEPWLLDDDNNLSSPQCSFYLDEKKEKLLLIGNHTVQVWYDQGPKRRTLEFIYMPLAPFLNIPEVEKWESKIIKVMEIELCIGKFKLNILTEDTKDSFQIKIEDEDDIINVAKYACETLKYFSIYKKSEQTFYGDDKKLKLEKLDSIIEQTRKIILRFIRLYPTKWRLLDIRYNLMCVLIESGDYELVNDILSFGELIHIPQYSAWSGEINAIHTALLDHEDHTMLACFLEYYSKNAIHNLEWMNTVVDIIPELYYIKPYKYYAQKLLYNPCFCNKQLDLFSFEFIEILPRSNDLLKVLIPITQLIPLDSELNLQVIDYNKIVDVRMVPLTNFTTNKIISDIRERKPRNFLKRLISPSQHSSLKEEDYSPFIKLVKRGERDLLYENPSMGAVINWMWHSSKFYWHRN
ncbi:31554_t:CDS:2, partial [Racocetra persica]